MIQKRRRIKAVNKTYSFTPDTVSDLKYIIKHEPEVDNNQSKAIAVALRGLRQKVQKKVFRLKKNSLKTTN